MPGLMSSSDCRFASNIYFHLLRIPLPLLPLGYTWALFIRHSPRSGHGMLFRMLLPCPLASHRIKTSMSSKFVLELAPLHAGGDFQTNDGRRFASIG